MLTATEWVGGRRVKGRGEVVDVGMREAKAASQSQSQQARRQPARQRHTQRLLHAENGIQISRLSSLTVLPNFYRFGHSDIVFAPSPACTRQRLAAAACGSTVDIRTVNDMTILQL